MKFDHLITQVTTWAKNKEILVPENVYKQALKMHEETGELSGALLKNNRAEIIDGIGDSFVTLIILSKQLGLDPAECLETAYSVISNRKGKTKNGVFVKEEDL